MKKDSVKKKLFQIDDSPLVCNVSTPRFSPDGRRIAYGLSVPNISENKRNNFIAVTSTDEYARKIITQGGSHRWSPDGSWIAFESIEGNLCVYNLENETVKIFAKLNHSAHFINHLEDKSFLWSPDGKYIAYLSTAPNSKTEGLSRVRVMNRLLYKTKGGRGRSMYNDGLYTHVFILSVSDGTSKMITDEPFHNHSISWSANSLEVAFVSNRTIDPDNNQNNDLWKINIATKKCKRLTQDLGTVYNPKWSPCGKFIAYLATKSLLNTNDSMAEDTHIHYVPADGGTAFDVTESLDCRVVDFLWHSTGKSIYFTAENKGESPLYSVSMASKKIEIIMHSTEQRILDFDVEPVEGKIAFARTDITHPTEIFTQKKLGDDIVQLTNENTELVKNYFFQKADNFWFNSFDGTKIQGWIMKPVNFDSTKMYPLILAVHSGPHNMFGYEFEKRIQLLAASGYATLCINPRGSSGYGQNFSNGNLMDWGGADYKDLMFGVDYNIARYNWIDKHRLGVTGQSYGGYMANWIITQTNRFKAAVVDGGISNLISFSGTSVINSLIESDFNGDVYCNYDLLWERSPLRYSAKVSTPTLFLHGEVDNEVPPSQAEEMYTALKKRGINTTLVLYVGEGHGWRPDLKPENEKDLLKRMINWFNLHITTDEDAKNINDYRNPSL